MVKCMAKDKEIVAIADDTTGALDVAGSFFSRGYDSSVQLSTTGTADTATAVVFDLNNRYEADLEHQYNFAENVRAITKKYETSNVFLKVDSTLRGHLQSDVQVLSELFGNRQIFIAPAFPHGGRLCTSGQYTVEGKPITETFFAQDHSFKIKSPNISNNFTTAKHIGIATIEQGTQAIIDAVVQSGSQIFTFDTTTQSDLESIALAGTSMQAICVGSAGLARAFPLTSAPFQNQVDSFHDEVPGLFVIGSTHPKARQQRSALRDLRLFEITLKRSDLENVDKLLAISEQIQASLNKGNTSVLASPDNFGKDTSYMQAIEMAMRTIADFSAPAHNLILVGGETARGVLIGRGIHTLRISGEFEPGIPISQPADENSWHVLTKAGGFGSQYVLNLIYRSMYRNKL